MIRRLEVQLLEGIRAALEQHDNECEKPPQVLLLNPGNRELLGWSEAFGLPVLSDPSVGPLRCKVVCGRDGWAGEHNGSRVCWIGGVPYAEVHSLIARGGTDQPSENAA